MLSARSSVLEKSTLRTTVTGAGASATSLKRVASPVAAEQINAHLTALRQISAAPVGRTVCEARLGLLRMLEIWTDRELNPPTADGARHTRPSQETDNPAGTMSEEEARHLIWNLPESEFLRGQLISLSSDETQRIPILPYPVIDSKDPSNTWDLKAMEAINKIKKFHHCPHTGEERDYLWDHLNLARWGYDLGITLLSRTQEVIDVLTPEVFRAREFCKPQSRGNDFASIHEASHVDINIDRPLVQPAASLSLHEIYAQNMGVIPYFDGRRPGKFIHDINCTRPLLGILAWNSRCLEIWLRSLDSQKSQKLRGDIQHHRTVVLYIQEDEALRHQKAERLLVKKVQEYDNKYGQLFKLANLKSILMGPELLDGYSFVKLLIISQYKPAGEAPGAGRNQDLLEALAKNANPSQRKQHQGNCLTAPLAWKGLSDGCPGGIKLTAREQGGMKPDRRQFSPAQDAMARSARPSSATCKDTRTGLVLKIGRINRQLNMEAQKLSAQLTTTIPSEHCGGGDKRVRDCDDSNQTRAPLPGPEPPSPQRLRHELVLNSSVPVFKLVPQKIQDAATGEARERIEKRKPCETIIQSYLTSPFKRPRRQTAVSDGSAPQLHHLDVEITSASKNGILVPSKERDPRIHVRKSLNSEGMASRPANGTERSAKSKKLIKKGDSPGSAGVPITNDLNNAKTAYGPSVVVRSDALPGTNVANWDFKRGRFVDISGSRRVDQEDLLTIWCLSKRTGKWQYQTLVFPEQPHSVPKGSTAWDWKETGRRFNKLKSQLISRCYPNDPDAKKRAPRAHYTDGEREYMRELVEAGRYISIEEITAKLNAKFKGKPYTDLKGRYCIHKGRTEASIQSECNRNGWIRKNRARVKRGPKLGFGKEPPGDKTENEIENNKKTTKTDDDEDGERPDARGV